MLISCGYKNELGSVREYYPDGAKMILSDTINGGLNGVLNYYYANGNIKSVQHWRNGLPNGDFLFYNENGDIIQHEIFNSDSNQYKLIIGDNSKYPKYYDEQLINFYCKNLKIEPDTGYYLGIDNYLIIKNIPYHLLRISSNNGEVRPYGNFCIAHLKTNERHMILGLHVILDGKLQKVITLNREVKLIN
jgi:hypothetical protein